MKKIFFVIILIVLLYFGYNLLKKNNDEPPKFKYEDLLNEIGDKTVNVNRLTIYGKYLNLEGNLPEESDNYYLTLKNNEEEINFPIETNENNFSTNQYINDGINLEKLKQGDYLLLLCNNNPENKICYHLKNNTTYHDNKYWTMTKNNKNNLITFNEKTYNEHNYWEISIKEETLPSDVYDIVIDPGHGGVDTGAGNGNYHESSFTLDYAKSLKEALEEYGLKVKLTREENIGLDIYGEGSRTGIPYEVNAKLMLSIHLNSSIYKNQKGVEIYRAYEDNNTFAKTLADNIVKEANVPYSINPQNKILDGVYMRVYSKDDIKAQTNDAKKNGYEPYNFTDHETYYYFIRETGGIMTHAFSDGRNPKYKENLYRNRNQAVEAYLCELAYISNNDDLHRAINNKEGYIKGLTKSILSYAEINEEIPNDNKN